MTCVPVVDVEMEGLDEVDRGPVVDGSVVLVFAGALVVVENVAGALMGFPSGRWIVAELSSEFDWNFVERLVRAFISGWIAVLESFGAS